jgi:ribosome-associated protein
LATKVIKKAAPKKAAIAPKKAASKKAASTPKKAASKKAASTPKKAAPKKAAPATKKATPKKAASATKKAAPKKVARKKAAPRKVATKTRKKTPIVHTDEGLEQLHQIIIDAIQDRKGVNIVSLDLRNIEDSVADYFIICTGDATTQIKSIADNVEVEVRNKLNEKPWHIEGTQNLEWVIVDFVNIVVHVFKKDIREYYKLEDLWSDADKKTFK